MTCFNSDKYVNNRVLLVGNIFLYSLLNMSSNSTVVFVKCAEVINRFERKEKNQQVLKSIRLASDRLKSVLPINYFGVIRCNDVIRNAYVPNIVPSKDGCSIPGQFRRNLEKSSFNWVEKKNILQKKSFNN